MKKKLNSLITYIAGIIAVPLLWYLTANILFGTSNITLGVILAAACIFAILIPVAKSFLFKKSLIEPLSLNTPQDKKYYITYFIVCLCMPIFGLAINSGTADLLGGNSHAGLFGDFSSPVFYIIALLNGLLLLIPHIENNKIKSNDSNCYYYFLFLIRLLLFYLKSAGYTYILYFFIVFFPYMPLGLIGIIFYGLGIFVLVPAMAAFLQGLHLVREWAFLSKSLGHLRLSIVFALGIITLPLCITATFWRDRENFNIAMQYMEYGSTIRDDLSNLSNSTSKDTNILDKDISDINSASVNLNRLKRSLKNAKLELPSTRNIFELSQQNTPIISGLYSKYILKGITIPQEKILILENLFFDAGHNINESMLSSTNTDSNNTRLIDASSETTFDEKNNVYRTWVNLRIQNTSGNTNQEYKTIFKLPEGAYISNYYLDVFGVHKEGILADHRAALFIYRKIVNMRKDPGLLHYIAKNTLELAVFPFGPQEIRETGFEIIHSQKFDLNIDNTVISTKGDNEQQLVDIDGAILLPSQQKADLKPVQRAPKYYFVIDCSKNSDVAWHIRQVQGYAKAKNIENADVIFASYKILKTSLDKIAQAEYKAECGFNLNLAVNMILSNESDNSFPIIIAVTDNILGGVLPQNIYPLSKKFPESPHYYVLNYNFTLKPYSYEDNKESFSVSSPIIEPILDFNGIYVLDNNKNELVILDENNIGSNTGTFIPTGNQYKDAILLDTLQQKNVLKGKANSIELVRASFRAGILTPQTAFIVVETQEQEKELLDLQENLLNGNEAISKVTLAEPSLLICILIFGAALIVMKLVKMKQMKHRKKA